mgnify:CR=1 FL=1
MEQRARNGSSERRRRQLEATSSPVRPPPLTLELHQFHFHFHFSLRFRFGPLKAECPKWRLNGAQIWELGGILIIGCHWRADKLFASDSRAAFSLEQKSICVSARAAAGRPASLVCCSRKPNQPAHLLSPAAAGARAPSAGRPNLRGPQAWARF